MFDRFLTFLDELFTGIVGIVGFILLGTIFCKVIYDLVLTFMGVYVP
jgi:hypothetical protein